MQSPRQKERSFLVEFFYVFLQRKGNSSRALPLSEDLKSSSHRVGPKPISPALNKYYNPTPMDPQAFYIISCALTTSAECSVFNSSTQLCFKIAFLVFYQTFLPVCSERRSVEAEVTTTPLDPESILIMSLYGATTASALLVSPVPCPHSSQSDSLKT